MARDEELADGTRVVVHWSETGGPPIEGTPSPGSGTELMTGLLRAELRGGMELGFPPGGVSHRIIMRFDLAYPGTKDGRATDRTVSATTSG